MIKFSLEKYFLDGGAYALGHLLVWSASFSSTVQQTSAPLPYYSCIFWPVADTGLAIWRRWKLGNPAGRPDRLHFHQLAMRFLEIPVFGRDRREIANPLATLILIPLISAPQVLGVLFWNDFKASVVSSTGMGLLFLMTYLFGITVAKKGALLVYNNLYDLQSVG